MSRAQKYSDEELLNHIRDVADEEGVITSRMVNAADGASRPTYCKHFDSWSEAVALAGLEIKQPAKYTEEELVAYLHDRIDGDTPPAAQEWKQADHNPSYNAYLRCFGSWDDALNAAGYDAPKRWQDGDYEDYSRDELIEWIDAFVHEFGIVPAYNDFCDPTWPGPHNTTYERRFGSWTEAIQAAGYTPRSEQEGDDE